MNLALAILAGLGTQAWIESGSNTHVVDLRRGLRLGAIGIGLFALATSSFWWNWLIEAKRLGVLRETATASVIPLLAGGAILGLLWWSRRSSRQESTGARFGAAVLAVVATELLIFAIPVATVVDRGDADLITPAHQVVAHRLPATVWCLPNPAWRSPESTCKSRSVDCAPSPSPSQSTARPRVISSPNSVLQDRSSRVPPFSM